MAHTAGPCLVTELVLAAGFLTLVAIRIEGVVQFGVVTAAAMLLTWLANALALPLVLSVLVRKPPRARPAPAAVAARFAEWSTRVALARPGRVTAVAAVALAAALALARQVEVRFRVFDDLRPASALARDVVAAEDAAGGLVPIAIHVEARGDAEAPALDPAAIRLAERAASFLRGFPEIRQANSLADVVRPLHRALAGADPEGDGLPLDGAGVAQELGTMGDPRVLSELLSADRTSLAAVGRAADVGSVRVSEMFEEIDAWVAREQAALDATAEGPRLRLSATGQLRLFQDVSALLLGGLLASFAGAVLVSVAVMAVALRSLRLGLVALVPNLAPMLLMLAFMGAARIRCSRSPRWRSRSRSSSPTTTRSAPHPIPGPPRRRGASALRPRRASPRPGPPSARPACPWSSPASRSPGASSSSSSPGSSARRGSGPSSA
jgi:predicted RND superfamily exporter protein